MLRARAGHVAHDASQEALRDHLFRVIDEHGVEREAVRLAPGSDLLLADGFADDHDRLALLREALDLIDRQTVVVAAELDMLDVVALTHAILEERPFVEVVALAMNVTAAFRASRCGDCPRQATFDQHGFERGLAGAGRAGQGDDHASSFRLW